MASEWTGVGRSESKLIRKLLFDSGVLDPKWIVRKDVLSMKQANEMLLALDDDEFFTLVKRVAAEALLERWTTRPNASDEVR
jgi:hypothetical protein